MSYEIKCVENIPLEININIDSKSIDKKMKYVDSIFLNRLLENYIKEYIYHIIEEKEDMLNDEVLNYITTEYNERVKSLKDTDGLDLFF